MRRWLTTWAGLIWLVAVATNGQVTNLYTEGFAPPVPTGDGNTLLTYGWSNHQGDNGALMTNVTTTGRRISVVPDAAAPDGDGSRVFLYTAPSYGNPDYLTWTAEYTVNLNLYTGIDFSWANRNNDTLAVSRLAIRINDNGTERWFATTNLFTSPTSTAWVTNSFTFTTAGTNWIEFAFNGTTNGNASAAFNVGSTTVVGSLPSGNITAFGLYSEPPNNDAMRFDVFKINATAIPEPSSVMLVSAGLLSGYLLRRRRR